MKKKKSPAALPIRENRFQRSLSLVHLAFHDRRFQHQSALVVCRTGCKHTPTGSVQETKFCRCLSGQAFARFGVFSGQGTAPGRKAFPPYFAVSCKFCPDRAELAGQPLLRKPLPSESAARIRRRSCSEKRRSPEFSPAECRFRLLTPEQGRRRVFGRAFRGKAGKGMSASIGSVYRIQCRQRHYGHEWIQSSPPQSGRLRHGDAP